MFYFSMLKSILLGGVKNWSKNRKNQNLEFGENFQSVFLGVGGVTRKFLCVGGCS